jgi:hypothetical protein
MGLPETTNGRVMLSSGFNVGNLPGHPLSSAPHARAAAPLTGTELPIRIHSGPGRPADAYAAVEYRDHWFWIDDTDFLSKRVFTFLMIMLSLAETGLAPGAPLLTVSAGG